MKSFLIAAILLFATTPTLATTSGAMSPWRSSISLPAPSSAADQQLAALDRFVIGWQLGDEAAVTAALADTTWSMHLREWARARWALQRGELESARSAYTRAAQRWPRVAEEPALVLSIFDRERIALALRVTGLQDAARIASSPLRAHDDAVWEAQLATLEWKQGAVDASAARFDASWARAARLDRRDPVYGSRALVHLAAGDTTAAGQAWIAYVENLRRPERLRAALAIWETEPALARAVGDDPRRRVVLDWLVRLFRRQEAGTLARAWIERTEGVEAAELFVFIAEQAYRLRQSSELSEWLGRPWPAELSSDQRAALEAYPWGVRRRGGHSEEIAAAFDDIADRYLSTPRAAEARWEAAWMWELSERVDLALQRFEQYLQERPGGPFASAAALRAVFLRWRTGDFEGAIAAYRRHASQFGDALDGAAGTWLAANALQRVARVAEADALLEKLRLDHPASPMWRDFRSPNFDGADVEDQLRSFAQAQAAAWKLLARHLELENFDPRHDHALRDIDRLAELGLMTEAEVRLADWADARRADSVSMAHATALAHRHGLPELQGRFGWILDRRLRDRGGEVAEAVAIVSLPTPFARAVLELGAELDVAPELIWALMRRESFYDADVLSIAGAYGLLQLIPRTASEMASRVGLADPRPEELFVPSLNLRLGTGYLAGLLREADGDQIRALASYNAGESNGVRWQQRRRAGEPAPLGILVISYSETRAYVYHVLRLWNLYADAYHPRRP